MSSEPDLLYELEKLVRKSVPSAECVFGGTRVVLTCYQSRADTLFPMPGGKVELRLTLVLGPQVSNGKGSVKDEQGVRDDGRRGTRASASRMRRHGLRRGDQAAPGDRHVGVGDGWHRKRARRSVLPGSPKRVLGPLRASR